MGSPVDFERLHRVRQLVTSLRQEREGVLLVFPFRIGQPPRDPVSTARLELLIEDRNPHRTLFGHRLPLNSLVDINVSVMDEDRFARQPYRSLHVGLIGIVRVQKDDHFPTIWIAEEVRVLVDE